MEEDSPSGDMSWIDFGPVDLSEDCSESNKSNKKNGATQRGPQGRGPSVHLRGRQLRRAVVRSDAARVEELLRGVRGDGERGFPEWPTKTLREAMKHAADAATFTAFAAAEPKFFHGEEGAPLSVFLAVKSGKEEKVRMLLAAGVSPEAESRLAHDGTRALHWACAWGRPDATRALLEAGADATARAEHGLTPLHIAANLGHTQCVEVLLSAGSMVDVKELNDWTELHHAASTGRAHCVRALLEAGAAPDAGGSSGLSPLHVASRGFCVLYLPHGLHRASDDEEDYAQCCELLLAHGVDVQSTDEDGLSPVQHAIVNRNCTVFDVLGKAGADFSQKLDNGETALHAASCNGFIKVVEDLLALGLDINACTTEGWTPLHYAISNWKMDSLEVLLRHGADIFIESVEGESPLFMAASNGFSDGLQAILKAGADPMHRASDGRTVLHVAATCSREAMKALVAVGVEVNARADDGSTPLLCAARCWNSVAFLEYLVEQGADLQARDNRGWTAIHFAASEGYSGSIRWLTAHADSDPSLKDALEVSARTANGATPLHLAAAAGEFYIIRLLLGMGASVAVVDWQGRTALHTAARGTCEETVRALLETCRGGDRLRGIRDANGDTPAQVAHVAAIRRMLDWWSVAG